MAQLESPDADIGVSNGHQGPLWNYETKPTDGACHYTDVSMSDSELVAVFSALGHEIRFSVWRLLLPHGTDGLPAGTIAVQMSIPPSSLSFHLRQMTHAGVLVQRRYRRNVIYAVNLDVLDQLAALQVISFGPTRKSSHEVCHIIGD